MMSQKREYRCVETASVKVHGKSLSFSVKLNVIRCENISSLFAKWWISVIDSMICFEK